ncbi:MAG: LysM peptidoglycan-binding domain-containing protein [Rhodoferax sp.]
MVKFKATTRGAAIALNALAFALVPAVPASAQGPAVTQGQRATADQVARAGIALSELASNAPESHTVQRGDTLWAISSLFLKSPWRWPELWGMNLSDIKNPHLIYPGQKLYLEKKDGRATLLTQPSSLDAAAGRPVSTVRLSPRTRYESVPSDALPTWKIQLIEPYLAEPIIVDQNGVLSAARIVAAQEGRVLITRGDRAYARGQGDAVLLDDTSQKQKTYRVFREATPLKDPVTGEILGYEAQYLGKALLVRGESTGQSTDKDGKSRTDVIPATIDIVAAKEEIRAGDRLLPEPERQLHHYVPHAPQGVVDARIVSVYGNAVVNAAQSQVVAINRGTLDGVENGHVLAILKNGGRLIDKTDEARTELKLPDERNGLLIVYRAFDRLSYGLVLEITDVARVGDRLVNPR